MQMILFYSILKSVPNYWEYTVNLADTSTMYLRLELINADDFIKGQMHHHDDLGSKCAYMCHLSNKTTRKSVLLSTPQIWLMKVSKKLA